MKTPAHHPEMDLVYGLPSAMTMFSVGFLTEFFRTGERHFLNQIESGALTAYDLRTPGAAKGMWRIPRPALFAFVNETPRPPVSATHGLPDGMAHFSVVYLSRFFATSDQHWINLVETKALPAHDLSSPGTSKSMWRIPWTPLLAFLDSRRSA